MRILFFCPFWGLAQPYVEAFREPVRPLLEKIKAAGYDGVETHLPFASAQKKEFLNLLKAYDLALIAQHWAATGHTAREYLPDFEKHLYNAAEAEALFINSQTGKDFFTFDENVRILERAFAIGQETSVKVVHETHRGKFSFHGRTLLPYLERFPDLRLTADFSHWCNVSESLLQDQGAIVQQAVGRADHIHSRVGHSQAAQVNDPRAPEWGEALDCHLAWWDAIVAAHQRAGSPTFTITTEFGPDPYMPALPFTRQPVTSQWDANVFMMELLRKRYESMENGR
jgi:sugar phosphate isomerase/epimerase